MTLLGDVIAVLVVVTLLVSVAMVRLLTDSSRRWGDILRSRLLFGVPWGTIVVVVFVLSVYLFVQDGISDFNNPVVLPYRAWSFLYPLGMVTAPFAHSGVGHLRGNLMTTIVVGPIAEFAWSHYTTERGRETYSSWWHHPWMRAFVIFPGVVIGVGLVTIPFVIGNVIGFSGVVFALVGFAIVRYPISTLIAVLGARPALNLIYVSVQSPIFTYVASPSAPSAPSWATTAIQGHAVGFLVGLLLALYVFQRRGYRPDPLRLWVAVLFYGISRSFWAIYWFRGANQFILYRGPGIIVVLSLAAVVVIALTGSDRSILPRWLETRLSKPTNTSARLERTLTLASAADHSGDDRRLRTPVTDRIRVGGRVRELVTRPRPRVPESLTITTRQQAAALAIVLVLAAISGPAIPANLFVVSEGPAVDAEVTVEDYTITYAEGIENPLLSVLDNPLFSPGAQAESSGVIVTSTDRHIWAEAVSTQRLEFSGSATVYVGSPGWREAVSVNRQGWSPVGNDTVYQVWLHAGEDESQLAFTANDSQAAPQIEGHNVSVVTEGETFALAVDHPDSATESRTTVGLPEENDSVTAGDLELVREDDTIVATTNDSSVEVVTKESYD